MTPLTKEQFPLVAAAVANSRAGYVQRSLDSLLAVLNKHIPTGSIPNPVFLDAKRDLNHAVDAVRSFEGLYREAFSAAYHFEPAKYQLDFMYANQVAGKVKLATKKHFQNKTWFALCTEILALYNALQSLKDGIVKRQGRSEEEKAEDYVPPMPTTAAAIKVLEVLRTMTDDLTKRYEDILYDYFMNAVDHRMANPRKRGDRYVPGLGDMLLNSCGDEYDTFTGNYTSLKANWKEILRNKAVADASYAQRMFLYKNVTKLAVIIENKGNLAEQKVLFGDVNGNGFSGEILFTFEDGSSFHVRNKVVHKYSVHNTPFLQFPTTFHDAFLAGGVKMPKPSEERMIEVFSKAKA